MVEAVIAPCSLDSEDVERLLDDADLSAVATLIGADQTGVDIGDVLAEGAESDLLLDLEDGAG